MFQGLVESFLQMATWLQAMSESVPVSQISIAAWLMLNLGGLLAGWSPFKASEQ